MQHIILYIISLLLGSLGAWLISRWGKKLGLLDKANQRSSHAGAIPKGGGIGILAAFIFSSFYLKLPFLIWSSVVIVSLSSFYGDRKEIPPKIRLIIQFLSGVGVLAGLFYLEERSYWVYMSIPFLSLFVVGTANYYNFMDGINGIAGITGVVAFSLIFLFSALSNTDMFLLPLGTCMAFACIGFLPFNLPKARVFLGDVGSILLGFVYALLVVGLSQTPSDFIVLCSFLFPFYADELVTTFVRLRSGEDLMTPHRKHIYQLLANEMHYHHWKISMGYGILQLLIGLSVLAAKPKGLVFLLVLISIYFLGFTIFSTFIRIKADILCNS